MSGTNISSRLIRIKMANKRSKAAGAEQIDESIVLPDGKEISYILDRGVRKNMYLCISDRQIILKVPARMPAEQARDFLLSKANWIEKNIARKATEHKGFADYSDGEIIKLLDEQYTLRLVHSRTYRPPYFSGSEIIVSVNNNTRPDRIKLSVDKFINDFTDEQIRNSFQRLCALTGLYPEKVTVKSMTRSWGRCSSDKRISINRNIIYHSQECLDYVVIHELCHLVHMNHSRDFWALVEKYCPDRIHIRKLLNE